MFLKDGTILVGWPEYYSTDMSQPGPELYLTEAKVWNIEKTEWIDVDGVRGILMDASEINRIEFLDSPSDGEKETTP